ncbi:MULTISPECIES: N-acetylmuramoyl-L-alanine amidase family protein [Flavobacteriaceae]|uniref:N-acetylmuramoyl-L-alanine amidase n=2 Tax=Flavobacteriaceae TaxID=49546 RepID=A0A4Y8AQ85_9FLAO|nr:MULTISPECIES: N-acetylmuramoyl-L-alanine amidase [Flavobacteriaceae]TEW72115.1 N-acetylmuramoyl-L-alanine amidase [Gramella jeungdoensis]GGK56533.1 N-acetylmuramoyl-L-alanine amidase [Lutibacter litoralis]
MNSLLFSKIKISTIFLRVFVFFCVILFNNNNIIAQKTEFIVVLDAGHGGKDPGKVGYKAMKEKDIALKIVLQVGKMLEKRENIKVIYTRKTDVFIGLKDRGKIANKADADLFVSIHCNAHSSNAYGAETWVLGTHANKQNFEVAKAENSVIELEDNYKVTYKGFNPNSPESVIGLTLMQEEYLDQSIQLASIIQNEFTTKLKRKDRGVKQAGFVVLHQTYMPSILIETGFITNSKEGLYLNSKLGQHKFSESIYNGIKKYINELRLNTVKGDAITEVSTTKAVINKRETTNNEDLVFKVQIASGSRKLETKSYNFKGLKNVDRIKVGNSYKYYLGNTASYSEIEEFRKIAKSKGYKTAFIVAFKNGKKISVEEVLKKS